MEEANKTKSEKDEQCRCALKPFGKTSNKDKNKELKRKMLRNDSTSTGVFDTITSALSDMFNMKNK